MGSTCSRPDNSGIDRKPEARLAKVPAIVLREAPHVAIAIFTQDTSQACCANMFLSITRSLHVLFNERKHFFRMPSEVVVAVPEAFPGVLYPE
jgi:hypothetical protein